MIIQNEDEMKALGQSVGKVLKGGECIELIGDVGAGKTTLVKGVAKGLLVDEDVQSPSFTISRVYDAKDGLSLQHYDFYRLSEPGVMSFELAESLDDTRAITIIEWAQTVDAVLPIKRIVIIIDYLPDGEGRRITINGLSGFIEGQL